MSLAYGDITLVDPRRDGAESLADQAYFSIRELIVTLELAPGSVVSESALMQRLNMGRTPIREAMRTLAHEHLIEVYPRRGAFVAGIDTRDLTALSELRALLEPEAAKLAAERSTQADRLETLALIAELDHLSPTPRDLIQLDQRIHHHIYKCTHNSYLEQMCERQYMHALRIWFLALDRIENLAEAILEHRALLEAISSGDSKKAAKEMSVHINGFEASLRKVI
jgi:DNA-binding GntR family transcriptional regulator